MTSEACVRRDRERLEVDEHPAAVQVAFVPSTPMNDERLSTAGSCRITFAERLLALGHGGERDALWRLGDPLDHAGVLHREEALRHDEVEHDRQGERGDGDDERRGLAVEHPVEHRP